MKKAIYFFAIIILFLTSSSLAQIEVTIPDTSTDAGSIILVPVKVSDLTGLNIFAYEFEISYDSTIVRPTEVSVENTISESWDNLFCNLNNLGTLNVAAFNTDPLIGGGVLVYIKFNIIGQPCDSTELNFDYCEFADGSIPTHLTNGKIRINSNIINVTIFTNVLGNSKIIVDDTLRNIPFNTRWIKGSIHSIEVPSPQDMGNGIQYVFNYWSDGGMQKHSVSSTVDTTFTAFFITQYYLTIISDYGTPQGQAWYDSGTVALFSIENQILEGNDTRHNFISWTGIGENSYSGTKRDTTVIMNNPIIEQANWNNEYYLQVNSAYGNHYGEGWYIEGTYAKFGIDSTDIFRSKEHYLFNSWTGQGEGSYSGSNSQDSVIINNPIIENATWDVKYYVEVNSNPSGLIDTTSSGWYPSGSDFTSITAPDTVLRSTTYFFKEWLVNGGQITGNPIIVKVDSPLVLLASYNFKIEITVTTNIGTGTKVIVDEVEHNAPYVTEWFSNDPHTISVKAYQSGPTGTRYTFNAWNDGGERTHIIKPDQAKIYIASLNTEYYLEVKTNPDSLFSVTDSGWYEEGKSITLTEAPQIGKLNEQTYRFKAWKVDGEAVEGNPITVVMNKSKIAEANYERAYIISGFIKSNGTALGDVQIILSGTEEDTLYSNQDGFYEVKSIFEGNYEIIPFKPGYRFEPKTRKYEALTEDLEEQNFVAIDTLTAVNIDSKDEIPQKYTLSQNYPNPFNSTTIIQYSLPQKTIVRLIVYNLLGQPVKIFISENQKPGNYAIQWNGKDNFGNQVPSGVYFYRLEANDRIISKKLIILE